MKEKVLHKILVPCKNSMNRSKSEIWVFSWVTKCSFIFKGLTSYKEERQLEKLVVLEQLAQSPSHEKCRDALNITDSIWSAMLAFDKDIFT